MKNNTIKFLLYPWKLVLGLIIILFVFFGIIAIPLSAPLVFGLSLAIGWKILLAIGYVYLAGLWFVCIINGDDVVAFALTLMLGDFI